MKKILFCWLLFPLFVFAQIGGSSVFEFTALPYSARETALGGSCIASYSKDLSIALKNPSLLDSSYLNDAFFSFGQMHVARLGLFYGTIGYAQTGKFDMMYEGGIHFINYGKCEGYDEDGVYTGDFFPSEYELIFGASKQLSDHWYVGASVKPILSYLESYSSYGLLFDFGANYRSELSCASVEIRNIGWQLKPYTSKNREPIPYSIDLGVSQRLNHAPIQFYFGYSDLQKFDLSYDDPYAQSNSLINDDDQKERGFVLVGKNFLKHITVSAEFMLGNHFVLMGGYNYRKSEELSFGNSKHGAGLSFGFELLFSRFNLSYGLAKQQAAGSWHLFTLGFNTKTIYSAYQNRKNSKTQE